MSVRNRKRARLEEDSSDDYESGSESASQMPSQVFKTLKMDNVPDWDAEEIERNVKAVCRYAISCEFKRKNIRRDDLNKLLTEGCRKMLNLVLAKSKEKLRHMFGFEIVELPQLNIKTNQSQTQKTSASSQKQPQDTQQLSSTQADKKSPGLSSGTYVLRSILKEEYRSPEIVERSRKEYQLTGILYVILGLIFINGQSMKSVDLNGHLDHLKITKTVKGVEDISTREALLSEFIKDNYLKKSKLPETDNDEPQFSYTWGPRAMVEVGHAGISAFLISFWGDELDDEAKNELNTKMWKQAGA
ncbi:MAGE family-domain-containing protein [Parasitella parasitica]|nr:MAGE family-domain-containing protein [Parasitella parasitica]